MKRVKTFGQTVSGRSSAIIRCDLSLPICRSFTRNVVIVIMSLLFVVQQTRGQQPSRPLSPTPAHPSKMSQPAKETKPAEPKVYMNNADAPRCTLGRTIYLLPSANTTPQMMASVAVAEEVLETKRTRDLAFGDATKHIQRKFPRIWLSGMKSVFENLTVEISYTFQKGTAAPESEVERVDTGSVAMGKVVIIDCHGVEDETGTEVGPSSGRPGWHTRTQHYHAEMTEVGVKVTDSKSNLVYVGQWKSSGQRINPFTTAQTGVRPSLIPTNKAAMTLSGQAPATTQTSLTPEGYALTREIKGGVGTRGGKIVPNKSSNSYLVVVFSLPSDVLMPSLAEYQKMRKNWSNTEIVPQRNVWVYNPERFKIIFSDGSSKRCEFIKDYNKKGKAGFDMGYAPGTITVKQHNTITPNASMVDILNIAVAVNVKTDGTKGPYKIQLDDQTPAEVPNTTVSP